MFHRFQIMMLTLNEASMKFKQISDEILTPPDPGMHQRDYSESKLEDVIDFDGKSAAYSSPRQRNPFIEDEAEGDSFREFRLWRFDNQL